MDPQGARRRWPDRSSVLLDPLQPHPPKHHSTSKRWLGCSNSDSTLDSRLSYKMGPLHPSLASLPPPLASNPLNPATAHLLSFIFTSGYVGSIYLSKVFSRVEVPPHSRKQGSGASVQREDSGGESAPYPSHRRPHSLHIKLKLMSAGPSIAIEPVTSTSTSTPSDPLTSAALDAAGPDAAPSTGDDQASDSQSDPDAPKPGERDHPATIRRRMKAVGVATALSLGGVWGVVKVQGGYTFVQAVSPGLAWLFERDLRI